MVEELRRLGYRVCRLLHPQIAALIACRSKEGRANVMTAAWAMPVSADPPMVAVSISPKRYSHKLISETGEFTVNIPSVELLDAVFYCGTVSGREVDKFEEAGLTPVRGEVVDAPVIAECAASLECRVVESVDAGDHTLFIGEVVAVHVKEGVFEEVYSEEFEPLLHLGGSLFCTTGKRFRARRKK